MTDADSVQMVVADQAKLNGWRIYGGHVYVGTAGPVSFLNCHFWDSMLVMPLTDVVAVGADVLVSECTREGGRRVASSLGPQAPCTCVMRACFLFARPIKSTSPTTTPTTPNRRW